MANDLTTMQERIYNRVIDMGGPDNNWVDAFRLGPVSALEALVAKGLLVPRVVHGNGKTNRYYRLRRDMEAAS